MRNWGKWLLNSDRNAGIVACGFMLLALIGLPGAYIATVLLAFVTMCKGPRSGGVVLLWVALPALSLMFLHRFGAFDIVLMRCIVVWGLATVLAKHHSWRLVLETCVVLGILFVVSFHFFIPDVKTWWVQYFAGYFKQLKAAGFSLATMSPKDQRLWTQFIMPVATGLMFAFACLLIFSQLLVARWWQASLFNPGGLRKEFLQIRLGRVSVVIAALTLIGVLFRLPMAIDVIPIVMMPFMIAGLSVLHFWVAHKRQMLTLLVLVYVGMIFMMFVMVSILAGIGFVDSWYDLRKHIREKLLKEG